MAEKMEVPISPVRGWVNSRTSIAMARYYSHMICGALSTQSPVGQGSRLGIGFGSGIAEINCVTE